MKKPNRILQKCNGRLCSKNNEYCGSVSPNKIYVCTRDPGHHGDHIACSGDNHTMLSWAKKKRIKRISFHR